MIFTKLSKTMIISKLQDNYDLQANLFSFVIHFGLFIFMLLSIQWQIKDVYYSEIELWDAMPMQVKPQPVSNKKKIMGINKGIVIFVNVCHLDAPSALAASYKSDGIIDKPARRIIA